MREVVTRATEAGDDATTLRWLPLLPPLGLSESLLPAYMAHARRALANRLPAASVNAAATDEIVYMQQLINECASFLQEQLPKANASLCSADGDRALLQLVHGECEKACIASATRFTAARELSSWIPRLQALQAGGGASAATAAGGSSGGASEDEQAAQDAAAQALLHEADGVLEEVACVLQHLESWDRFARHAASSIEGSARASAAPPLPATTPLNEECAELGGRCARAPSAAATRCCASHPPAPALPPCPLSGGSLIRGARVRAKGTPTSSTSCSRPRWARRSSSTISKSSRARR